MWPRHVAFLCREVAGIADKFRRLANEVLADLVVEAPVFGEVRDANLYESPARLTNGDRGAVRDRAVEAGRHGSGGPENVDAAPIWAWLPRP